MSTHLARGKLNVGLVQEQARKELLDLLDKCEGSKVIIWDDGLSGPFGLIAEYSLLKKRDVFKMYPLRPGKLKNIEMENVIFITRPYLKLMNCIADIIHGEETSRKKKKWHLFYVPTKSLLCQKSLENRGVFGSFTTIEQIPACLIFPFDSDLMSMELDSVYKEYYLESDPTSLYQVAQTLVMLQDLFGPIKRISGKGNAAEHVFKLLKKLEKESHSSAQPKHHNAVQIEQLILIDREVDLLSALATQLTYQGLIDELFNINNCTVKLPADRFIQEDELSDRPREKQLILNSADEVFSDICDKNFFAIGQSLSRRAKQISHQLDERHDGRTLQEMKQFVAKLPQMLAIKKSLANHMTIAEIIKEITDTEQFAENIKNEQEIILGMVADKMHPYIEDCMTHKVDIVKVLRLICMQSIVNCGLKPKVLEQYKRDLIQTYGFQHILTLTNLEKAGLLKIQQGSRAFTVLRNTLKLVADESNFMAPKDVHFVHGIYAPLTVRLAQQFAKPSGIRNLNDVISLLPGPQFDQPMNSTNVPFSQRRGSLSSQSDSSKVVLVFFIGGCTFAEISALRFLSQQEDLNVEFVIATTKIITGNTFIKSLMEVL